MTDPSPTRQQAAERLFARYHGLSTADQGRCVRRLAGESDPFYDEARRRWLVCGPEHARLVLRDSRFSNDLAKARATTKSAELARRLAPSAPSILFLDDPLHAVIRRALGERMAGPAVRGRTRDLEVLAGDLVNSAASATEFDLGPALVQPLAATILLDMLGFGQPADAERRELVDDLFLVNGLFDLTTGPDEVRAGRAASARVRDRIVRELSVPGGVGDAFRSAGVDMAVAIASLEFTLRAGIVTCSCLLANALTSALGAGNGTSREQIERLIVAASPSLEAGRVTVADAQVGRTTIPVGETVITLLPAANVKLLDGDEEVYGRHVAFGYGQHVCLGAQLVRAELRGLLRALAATGRSLVVHSVVARQDLPAFRGVRGARASLAG